MESRKRRHSMPDKFSSPKSNKVMKKSWKKYSSQEIQALSSAVNKNMDLETIINSNILPGRDRESIERRAKKMGLIFGSSQNDVNSSLKQTQQVVGLYNSMYPPKATFTNITTGPNGEETITTHGNIIKQPTIQPEPSPTSSFEDSSGPIISWHFISEEDHSIYFIIKEVDDVSFSVQVEEQGLLVVWSAREPPDSVWQLIQKKAHNLTSREFYRSIAGLSGEYFIRSPRLLETHPNLSEKIENNLKYRLVKIKIKHSDEKKIVF